MNRAWRAAGRAVQKFRQAAAEVEVDATSRSRRRPLIGLFSVTPYNKLKVDDSSATFLGEPEILEHLRKWLGVPPSKDKGKATIVVEL